MAPQSSRGNNNKRNGVSLLAFLTHFLVGVCGVYIGISMGSIKCPVPDTSVQRFTAEEWKKKIPIEKLTKVKEEQPKASDNKVTFPETVKGIVVDYATIHRDKFNDLLEIGVPLDETKNDEEVFVLYTDPKTLPSAVNKKKGIHGRAEGRFGRQQGFGKLPNR